MPALTPAVSAGRLTTSIAVVTVLACAPVVAVRAQSTSLFLRGNVGALHEWSLRVHLEASPSAAGGHLLNGPMTLLHTGSCSARGHTSKVGSADASVVGGKLHHLEMRFDDEHCVLEGPIPLDSGSTHGFMKCSKGLQVPISLWSEDAPQSGRGASLAPVADSLQRK